MNDPLDLSVSPGEEFTLADLDADGALEEAAAAVFPTTTRLGLFRRGVIGGGALVAALALPGAAEGRLAKTKTDIAIVRFDVVLEYLQSALYVEAERLGALKPKTLDWARVVGAHELAHAKALKRMLDRPPKRPSFNFRDVTQREASFVKTAVAFEDLTAALLKWQALRLDSRQILAAAATLHSVETRHAAWIRRIVGARPSPRAFDDPAPQRSMERLIASTGFVTAKARTTRKRKTTRYTG
jgi:ferritin-like protein